MKRLATLALSLTFSAAAFATTPACPQFSSLQPLHSPAPINIPFTHYWIVHLSTQLPWKLGVVLNVTAPTAQKAFEVTEGLTKMTPDVYQETDHRVGNTYYECFYSFPDDTLAALTTDGDQSIYGF